VYATIVKHSNAVQSRSEIKVWNKAYDEGKNERKGEKKYLM
jgi:hypothetical protein